MIFNIPDKNARDLYLILCKAQISFEYIIPEQDWSETINMVCAKIEQEDGLLEMSK